MSDLKPEEMKAKLEVASLDENINRVDYLMEGSENPGVHALGMKLALTMAKELLEKKEVGTDSGVLVQKWMNEYPESIVEEAIKFSREFLLNPQSIKDELSKRLWEKGNDESTDLEE